MSRLISFLKEPVIYRFITVAELPRAVRRAYLWAIFGGADIAGGAARIAEGSILWGGRGGAAGIIALMMVIHHAGLIDVAVVDG